MNPIVTVIIPTYNRHAALAELLEALTRQTFDSFEVLIVNDAGEPVDAITALYPELRVRVINHKVNKGHVYARNTALRVATSDWIMLCDDDDIILPDHMARMLKQAEEADLVYSDVEIVHYRWNETHKTRLPHGRRLFAYAYDRVGMRQFSTFVPSGCLYRRAIHDRLGDFDPEMLHYWDWDFFLRVSELFQVKRVPVASVLYAFAAAGASDNMSSNPDKMREHLNRLCAKHQLGQLPTKNFFLLLEEPAMKAREAASEMVWDGEPIISRLVNVRSE